MIRRNKRVDRGSLFSWGPEFTAIRDRLAALAPEALELLDESALHVGHCRMLPETRVRASDTDVAGSGK